jgi:heme exporter protein A
MFEAASLECVRGDRVLFSNVSFGLREGELIYLKGVNGSGKTSLLRMLCGLVAPQSGEVLWKGKNIRGLGEAFNAELTYIGHRTGIKADLTAVENLMFSCRFAGQPIEEDQAWEVLGDIGLQGREDLPTKVLSQGQQRRVALARLMVTRSPLWILDEPFVALDAKAVEMLQGILVKHIDQGGMIVLTTHQQVPVSDGASHSLQLGAA